MSFDEIEGLYDSQIMELYNEIIETGDGEIISANENSAVWHLNCNNGNSGFFLAKGYTGSFGNHYGWGSAPLYSGAYHVCGPGQWGYNTMVGITYADSSTTMGTFWEIRCNNGNTGFAIGEGYTSGLGGNHYGLGDRSIYGTFLVCGSGRYGYNTIVGYFYQVG